jgi:glycosyltransferase involved in cell wall biosynthesis
MKSIREFLKEFIFDQYCVPWFISARIREKFLLFQCQTNYLAREIGAISKKDKTKRKVECTFLIAHKDCSVFLKLCVDSICRYASNINYEVIIADDFSNEQEFSEATKLVSDRVRLYRHEVRRGHPFMLEWLYNRANSKYVVILDQDAILLSVGWQELFEEFSKNEHLLLIGARDQCLIRNSPQMVHPSFILLNKERCAKGLKPPYFFGRLRSYGKFEIGQPEQHHVLTCKVLLNNAKSVEYLENYQTKYGFGTVSYFGSKEKAIVYHQWYSGRIYKYNNDEMIDGFPVAKIRDSVNNFLRDFENNKLDLREIRK